MSKVSVIIPCYNCASYIEATITSVLQQTYPKKLIEVIIVNDGSTDNTASIINRYQKDFKIIHTQNRGVSHARNKGLEYATGDFIQYLDSDDILIPNKIEIQVKALKESSGDVAYGNWQKFIEQNNVLTITETIERKIEGSAEIALFTDFWCPPAAILYSKRIVKKIGLWKQWLPIIQDARYFLDAVLQQGEFVYTDTIVAQYREGNANSLSKRKKLFIIDCFKNTVDISKEWETVAHPSEERTRTIISSLEYLIPNLRHISRLKHLYAINMLLKMAPNFKPKNRIRFISNFLGYKKAEIFASKIGI